MTNNLCIERFRIDRAAGVPRDESWGLEFSSGINVILGDNGSGKTQTGLALMSTLWPQPQKLENLSAEAEFRWGENKWKVEVDGTGRKFIQDGKQSQPGPIELRPPDDQRAPHWIGLRELLDTGEDKENDNFAQKIIRDLRGGLDFEDAKKSLFGTKTTKPARLKTEVHSKKEEIDRKKRGDEKLRVKDGERETLERKMKEARDQKKKRDLIKTAIDALDYRQEIENFDKQINVLDPRVKNMDGQEQKRLEDLKGLKDSAQADLHDAQAKLEVANKKLQECKCDQDDEENQVLERCRQLTRNIEESERSVENETRRILSAQEKIDNFSRQYVTDVDLSELKISDDLSVKVMKSIARNCSERRQLQAKLDLAQNEFKKIETFLDRESDLSRAQILFEDWLQIRRNERGGKTIARSTVWIALATIVVSIAAAIIDFHWSVLIGIFGCVAVGIRHKESQVREGVGSRKSEFQDQYRTLSPNEPHFDWNDQEIHERSKKIEIDLKKAREASQYENEIQRDRLKIKKIDDELTSLEQQVKDHSGICFEKTDRDLLFVFGEAMVHWQAAMGEIQEAKALQSLANGELKDHCSEMTLLTEHLWGGVIESHADAERCTNRLGSEMELFRTATNEKDLALGNIETRQNEVQRWENAIRSEILAKLELTEISEHEIQGLHEQWAIFDEYRSERDSAERQLKRCEKDLAGNIEYLDRSLHDLEDERAKCEAAENIIEDLRSEIADIDAELRAAMEVSDIEKLQSDFENIKVELESELKHSERELAGRAVVDWLAEESAAENEPEALNKANEILLKITRGKYTIEMDGDEISARDHVLPAVKKLGLLSAGERVQLLLAVRVGFLEANENSVRLPIFLDELLGNSDDSRAKLIIQAIIDLCHTGRQVFYFTAQIDEQEKLKAQVEGTDLDLRTHDLNEVREIASTQRRPRRADRLPREIPSPIGRTHSEFGDAIGAPGFLGTDAVESIHLWHFIDEPEVLATCMKDRITTFGQFESVVLSGTYNMASFDEDKLLQIESRGKAMRAVLKGFNIGRGRYVHAIDIAECKAVADKFLNWFTELVEATNGDAKKIISAARENRPKGWGDGKTDKLEEAFVEGGYIVDEEPLSKDQVWHRGLQAAKGIDLGEGWLDRVIHELFG